MQLLSLFPGGALSGITLVPDTLYRVRLSYPQAIERDVINRITSLTSIQRWMKYIDGDGAQHWIWIEYITVDTTFNICDIYFYVQGSVAAVIIVGVLVIVGLLALALVVKQLAIVVRGYPSAPASRLELPLLLIGFLAILGVAIYYGTNSGVLSKLSGQMAAKI